MADDEERGSEAGAQEAAWAAGGEQTANEIPGEPGGPAEGDGASPHFVEVWNDYDPSQRFVVIFPVGEKEGARASSVAYYIIEPGKHSGVHSDNAEEVVFIAEGEGEVFMIGRTQKLVAGNFIVFPGGLEHDIYAQGAVALRLLSFFPATEILSTFQQVVFPVGSNVLSSIPPKSVVTELDPETLPQDFPFELDELGLADSGTGEEPAQGSAEEAGPDSE